MPDRVLFRGGHLLTMDPTTGDVFDSDVLVEDDTIAAVGRGLEVGDAEVVDASGWIVIPGFIDSHRHTWETVIRGVAPDVSLAGYFEVVLAAFAPAYRPEDVYVGNYLGALEAIDAGITTLLDWSHINNTPDHSDEAIRGLRNAGLRAVYCYGNPNTSLADWWYESELNSPEDIRRIREQYFSSDDQLITLAMGTRGPGFCKPEVVKHDWELARDVGAPISVHVAMGPIAGRFSMVKQLDEMGLLGADTTYIHCNYLSDEEFRLIADSGGKVSIAPSVEMVMGHGTPPTAKALAHGLRPSLSIDVVTTVPGDMFTQMRFLFATDRLAAHEAAFEAGNVEGAEAAHLARGARVRHDRGRAGLRARGPHRLADRRQAGRPRPDPRRPDEHLPGDRPGLDRRPPGRHPERRHGDGRRQVSQARRRARRHGSRRCPRSRGRLARPPPLGDPGPAELGPESGARAGVQLSCTRRPPRAAIPSPRRVYLDLTRLFSGNTLARIVARVDALTRSATG